MTGIILAFLVVYIILNVRTRKLIFMHKGSKIMRLFFAYSLIVPILYRNWLGFAVGIGVMFAIILGLFMRSVMTSALYEKVLTIICVLSLTSTSCAISEKFIIPLFDEKYHADRIAAMFSHPNYFGTIIATVIIICAYKVLTRQGRKWVYYVIALINVISLYLCESMFAWVEVFLGIAVLLMILKMHRILTIWFFGAALASFIIFVLNIEIIPRLSDAGVTTMLRFKIWNFAIKQIKISPLFGHGFMSYSFVYQKYYLGHLIPHAHNIYLDVILNFGVSGTVLFLWYFITYYISVIKVCFKEKNVLITSLILAVTAAALVHGATDITLLWIQTLPLFLLILAGLGAYEK